MDTRLASFGPAGCGDGFDALLFGFGQAAEALEALEALLTALGALLTTLRLEDCLAIQCQGFND